MCNRPYAPLGSGGTWSNAFHNLDGQGIGFPGGKCGSTGIGGLALGGGISYYAAGVGFVADNVLNSEVVLESGELVIANLPS